MASGSPQRRRSSVNVGFQENAENFVKQEINYEHWQHSIENSDENTLRKFLQKQAEGEFDDLKLRLQTLRGEADDIREHMNSFVSAAQKLHATTEEYMNKMREEEDKMKDTAESKEHLSQQIDKQKAEIQAMQDNKRDLMNDKNKELNGITQKEWDHLTKSQKKDTIQSFLLKSFAQIVSNNSSCTDHTSMQDDQFKDLASFQLAMRQVDGSKLDQGTLDEILSQISGSAADTLDAIAKRREAAGLPADEEVPEKQLTIFQMITNEKELQNNIHSFPFFRVLSKTYHHIIVLSKMGRHTAKLKHFEQELKQVDVKVRAHMEKIDALKVFSILEDEAKNIEENEVHYFQEKLNAVNDQINDITHLLSGTNFADEYFK